MQLKVIPIWIMHVALKRAAKSWMAWTLSQNKDYQKLSNLS